jgi:hypothetical protein
MLKAAVLCLLAANAAVFAWGRGWLMPLWLPPGASEREPERLRQQVRPDSITVLGPSKTAAAAATSASAAPAAPGTSANAAASAAR